MIDSRRKSSLILVVAAALASTASDCEQSPRGVEPSSLATIQVRLQSEPAAEPAAEEQAAFEGCLTRMEENNNVRPSWRNYAATVLNETAPNNFETQFFDVPVNIVHTMTVHDRNQCRRDPRRDGRVTTGVWVNGTRVERVVQETNALQFAVDEEGVVESPPIE